MQTIEILIVGLKARAVHLAAVPDFTVRGFTKNRTFFRMEGEVLGYEVIEDFFGSFWMYNKPEDHAFIDAEEIRCRVRDIRNENKLKEV